jgi:hypothetical protein
VSSSLRRPLGHDDLTLEQYAARLVHESRTLPDQPITDAMQNLDVELSLGLECDKPHRRSGRRLGDRLSVAVVVLLRLDVGTNILRRHQLHLVPLRSQQTPEVVRTTTRLHRHHAARQLGCKRHDALPPHPPAQHHTPRRVQPDHAAAVLAQVDPENINVHCLTLHFAYPDIVEERGGPFP